MAEFLGISSVAHMAVRVLEKHKGVVSMSFTAAVSSAQLCGAFWWLCTAKLSSPACHQADSDRKEAEQAWPWQQCGLAAGRRAVGSWLLQKYSVEWSWTGSALCFCLGDQEFLIPKGLCIISCFFCCCFSSITSCSYTIYSITTLWQFLPFYDMHPSNRWQPKGFQPVITMQGSFLKENKQMSRLGLMLGWQVPGNKHFVLKGTLRRSAGNSSSRASVVSHKSIVLSEAVNLKAALFPGQGTTALKFIQGFEGRSTERLRALCSCYFKILCRLCFVFAASLPLLHRDQHSRTLHDFCRFFFLLVSCRLLLPFSIHSKMSRLAFGGTFHMHAQGCESFRLLWSSVTGGRLSAARFQGLLISTSPSHSQPTMPKAVRLQPHCPPTNVSLSYDEYLRTYFVG